MGNVEMVEVRAKTVDLAVEAAMQEMGVESRDELSVEVVSEPVKGFLGLGGQDAVVVVRKKPARKRGSRKNRRDGSGRKGPAANKSDGDSRRGASPDDKNGSGKKRPTKGETRGRKETKKVSDDRPSLSVEEQATTVREFLEGLVTAYGLEGEVTTRVEDDVIVADIRGEQTEALVGVRGTVRSAIHELTRTVLQRYSSDTARIRLDIAGYAERRRQALEIYAGQLIDQLLEEGGEVMLEPMSPADRKVIHDVAAAREGVTSYSEGEPPRRYVVLSLTSDDRGETGDEEE